MVDQNQEPIIAKSSEEQQLQDAMDPTTYLLYHAPCSTPLSCCYFGSNSSTKRPSPSSSATATEKRAFKKLLHEKQDLTLNGVSTISFPPMHGTFPATHNTKPLGHADTVSRASCCLSPQPQSVKGFVCDHTPSPVTTRTFSRSSNWGDKEMILTKEEDFNSMKLRRMKECLGEMRKWWDEVLQEEEEEEEEDDPEGAESGKVLSKDDCGGDAEEAVKLEWADRCLSICFKCPCSKDYQILLSENNCYYKLV